MDAKVKLVPVLRVCGRVRAAHAFLDGYGEGYTNTADATAQNMDIAKGKTAYANGQKLEGSVPVYDFSLVQAESVTGSDRSVSMKYTESQRIMHNQDAQVTVSAPLEDFGDASAADVAKGKIFTSGSGFRVVGLSESNGGVYTGDATALASDLAVGKTAYAGGNKLVGTIPVVDFAVENAISFGGSKECISMMMKHPARIIYNAESTLSVSAPSSGFGDAVAEDVAEGKIFTSGAGFRVVGTGKQASLTAQGYGDTIIITTSEQVSSYGDDIIIGG